LQIIEKQTIVKQFTVKIKVPINPQFKKFILALHQNIISNNGRNENLFNNVTAVDDLTFDSRKQIERQRDGG
jgi:hypothetical protein